MAPAIVAAFDGWIDAGGASTAAAGRLAAETEPLVTFSCDLLYDYRSRRPVLDVVDGTLTELTWPEISIKRNRLGARDVLVLTGPEPDFRWRELGAELLDVALRLGVVEWVSLGAIPAAVPHTRPVPILATASKPGLLHAEEQVGPQGLLRVPAAALSALEHTVAGGGIPAVGFFAQVPHYVGGTFTAATIALLEHAARHLGVDVPLEGLTDEAMTQRERLDAVVAGRRGLEDVRRAARERRRQPGGPDGRRARERDRALPPAARGGRRGTLPPRLTVRNRGRRPPPDERRMALPHGPSRNQARIGRRRIAMRWRTELVLYVVVFVLFGALLLWVGEATAAVVALFGAFSVALLVVTVASLKRRRAVLVVGEGSEVERIDRALERVGYDVCSCAGPANRPCPVFSGRSCPIGERPLAALIYHPAGAGARYAPCGAALRVPAVLVEERADAEPDVAGRYARVGFDGGTDRVIRTMEELLAA